jgi:hypothetical protein
MPRPGAERLAWMALAAGSLAVGLVALGSGDGESGRPATRVLFEAPRSLMMLGVVSGFAAVAVFFAYLLALARHHGKDKEVSSALRALILLPVVVVVLAVLLRDTPLEQLLLGLPARWGTFGAEDPASGGELPPVTSVSALGTAVTLLALVVGLGSLALVGWLLFGERLQAWWIGARAPASPLAGAVEESLDDLRLEADVRLAILRCYRRFEEVLARSRVPRAPWQTATEFMAEALGRLPLPADAVRSLTVLFEIARFSAEPLGPADRDAAWEALVRIRASLGAGAGVTPGARRGVAN